MTLYESVGKLGQLRLSSVRLVLSLGAWNSAVAASTALSISLSFLGRTQPTQATLAWAGSFALLLMVAMSWLTAFSLRSLRQREGEPAYVVRLHLGTEGPLLILGSVLASFFYLSDQAHHHFRSFLYPFPGFVLLLAWLMTIVTQEMLIRFPDVPRHLSARLTMRWCRPWVLPGSLIALGLVQGFSYIWVIGNDFTRYWAVADAIATGAGYPASVHQAIYIVGGMNRYSIELPFFPLLLLSAFQILGHNTLAAHAPSLLANTLFPGILYLFYRRAGLHESLAFAGASVVVLFPFFRLYTLNAPVPDAVFITLLTATGWAFLGIVKPRAQGGEECKNFNPAEFPGRGRSPSVSWLGFGLLGAITSLTRPEGILFVGAMFLALLPEARKPGFWLAALALLIFVSPFYLVMKYTFRHPWPNNAAHAFAPGNVAANMEWLRRVSLPWYAEGLGLPAGVLEVLAAMVSLLILASTFWLVARRWALSVLPLAAALQVAAVFALDPRVSGVDQWFDFFRHVSYGIPFALLPILLSSQQMAAQAAAGHPRVASEASSVVARARESLAVRVRMDCICVILLLVCSAYEIRLLATPSKTYGWGSTQLLTSDVWVSFPNVVTQRRPLPILSFVRREGVLMIDPDFEYVPGHLSRMRRLFAPVSSLATGRGGGYQLSSLLLVTVGFLFAVTRPARWPVGSEQ